MESKARTAGRHAAVRRENFGSGGICDAVAQAGSERYVPTKLSVLRARGCRGVGVVDWRPRLAGHRRLVDREPASGNSRPTLAATILSLWGPIGQRQSRARPWRA